jgi:hypothetical protein
VLQAALDSWRRAARIMVMWRPSPARMRRTRRSVSTIRSSCSIRWHAGLQSSMAGLYDARKGSYPHGCGR